MGQRSIAALPGEQQHFQKDIFKKILPPVFAFVIMFSYGVLNIDISFRGDAYETWEVAKSLFNPQYAYRSFVEYRGFVSFFLMSLLYNLSVLLETNEILTFRFFSSLIFAIMTTISLPSLFSKVLGTEISIIKKVLFSIVVFYFFRGYFLHPSNDYLAFFFLVLSVNNMLNENTKPRIRLLGTGVLFAVAISCRLNYIVAFPILVVLFIVQEMKTALKWMNLLINLVILILPVVLLFAAEDLYKEHRNLTDGPRTFNPRGLVNVQLTYGLRYQRIEWGIGEAYQGPLYFWDDQGQAIFDEENIVPEKQLLSLRKYASLFLKYPFDFSLIYFRHFFNGLDITYPAIYVVNIYENRVLFSFLNYTLLLLAIKVINFNIKERLVSLQSVLIFLMLMLPALSTIPFVIEPRFFLPMTISLYSVAFFGGQIKNFNAFRYQYLSWQMVEYTLFVLVCFTLSSNTFSQAVDTVLLLSR